MPPKSNGEKTELVKGPNISALPDFSELSDFEGPVLLKMGDNISTDEILRAGAEVLPFRSNIPEISKFSFSVIDETYYNRAMETKGLGGHIVIAGENYAQGSSREHAAIAPRYLGQRAVIAKSYARIGWQNLINFGIVPFEFNNPQDFARIGQGDVLKIDNIRNQMNKKDGIIIKNVTKEIEIEVNHTLSGRQLQVLLDGGIINLFKKNLKDM